MMNKLWIEHSYVNAECCRDEFFDKDADDLEWFEYLDTIGLFETSWLIYEYHNERIGYGYPDNE
ncbi:hypothetical protein LCGC14_2515490 [marine sediment metagenome]|uniref:Uncharacterized protein n=1 Tax=marine sediment metagenome TaxID=412755 RepID=A0A0F9BKU9_9ZZZZ